MSDDAFNVIAAKLKEINAKMLADLNRDLFTDAATRPARPVTWRERWQRARWRVRAYVWNLWLALRGDDPYDFS